MEYIMRNCWVIVLSMQTGKQGRTGRPCSNSRCSTGSTVAALLLSLLQVLAVATASPYLIALAAAAAGVLPVTLLACLTVSLQPAKQLLDFADANHMVPAAIAPLKKFGVKWHIAVGLSLTLGLFISGH
eukprot:GHUV01057708.1.p1 GENE.GHUV01057708.1~~GHUV01057708.1.p1  ORF type:complete len:129 (+),score=37.97 GHUV01057708.1:242-628(+)